MKKILYISIMVFLIVAMLFLVPSVNAITNAELWNKLLFQIKDSATDTGPLLKQVGINGSPQNVTTAFKVGSGSVFTDGLDDAMAINNNNNFTGAVINRSIWLWSNFTDNDAVNEVFYEPNTQDDTGLYLRFNANLGTNSIECVDLKTATLAKVEPAPSYPNGNWELFGCGINGSGPGQAGTIYLFRNATIIAQTTGALNLEGAGGKNLMLGARGSLATAYYTGGFDAVHYLNKSPSTDDAIFLWNNGAGIELSEPIDTTPPSANITNINASQTLSYGKLLNITVFAKDETALTLGNITFNLTGPLNLYNFSFALSGTTALFSQNITISLTKGAVINATTKVKDSSGNVGENSTLITIGNSVPSPTIILPTPDDYNNTMPYNFSITYPRDADGDTITSIRWYINGLLNQTTLGNTTFNASDGYYQLNVSLFDGTDFSTNVSTNFTIDTTIPTLAIFNLTNNSIFGFQIDIPINITIQDNNPFNLTYRVYNASNPSIQEAYNDIANSSTTIMIVEALRLSNLSSGNYSIEINFSDRHTKTIIQDYSVKIMDDAINFRTAEGSDIYIIQLAGTKPSKIEAIKMEDRYTIDFGISKIKEIRQFIVASDNEIKIMHGSSYKGHLIIGKNWVDFEDISGDGEVTIERVDKNMVIVHVYAKNFKFNSIGGLNTVNVFYNFQVDNHVPYFPSSSINDTTPDQSQPIGAAFNCRDIIGLSTCIIAHNNSGSWVNATNFTREDKTTNEINYSINLTITAAKGNTIGFQSFANDTFNRFGSSDILTLQVNDDVKPVINGSINITNTSLVYVNSTINATFNATDDFSLDSGQIIITQNNEKRYYNFTLNGTKSSFSQNFTVFADPKNKINITGLANDTFGNIQINQTILTITQDLRITARNIYDNSTISSFTAVIFNATNKENKSTTNGVITFPDMPDLNYSINISSEDSGGYFNRSYVSHNSSINFQSKLYQAIVYFTAVRRGTLVNITNFNISLPLAFNQSNSTGGMQFMLNASNYLGSSFSDDYFRNTVILNLTNKSESRKIAEFYDINVSIALFSNINGTWQKNFTIKLTGSGNFMENLTDQNKGNVTFSLGNNTYDITLDAAGHALKLTSFVLTSNDTYPNLTFSLEGQNAINFTILDEITRQLITNGSIEIIGNITSTNFTVESGKLYIQDLPPDDYRITYSKALYKARDNYLTLSNRSNQSVDLYLLSLGNSTDITVNIRDESGTKLEDALINLKRYYTDDNAYLTVAESKSDFQGQSIFDVDFDDAFYILDAAFGGFSEATKGSRIFSTSITITIILAENPFVQVDAENEVTTSLIFNNDTQTFSYTFTDLNGINRKGILKVVKVTAKGDITLCENTATSSSATIVCQAGVNNTNNTLYATGAINSLSDDQNFITNTLEVSRNLATRFKELIGTEGLFLSILFAGTVAGLGIANPAVAIILFLVGLSAMIFTGFGLINTLIYFTIVIFGLSVIWRLKT